MFSAFLDKDRNLVERFFNKLKPFRRVATRCDKLADNFLSAVAIAVAMAARTARIIWAMLSRGEEYRLQAA